MDPIFFDNKTQKIIKHSVQRQEVNHTPSRNHKLIFQKKTRKTNQQCKKDDVFYYFYQFGGLTTFKKNPYRSH